MSVIPPSTRGSTGHQSCPVWGSPEPEAVAAAELVVLTVEVVTEAVVGLVYLLCAVTVSKFIGRAEECGGF